MAYQPEPAPPPRGPVAIKRGGRDVTRTVPLPTVVIDTREQRPFDFSAHPNWIGGVERRGLATGDYSIVGMEDILALERKSLADLIFSLTHNRTRFISACERLSEYHYRAIIVEATYEEIKTPYPEEVYRRGGEPAGRAPGRLHTRAHPNGISGSLDAINARFGIGILYTSRNRALSQERAARWLSKHYLYWHLETTGRGRCLQDDDL
jgi:ERCC4-type nuclease